MLGGSWHAGPGGGKVTGGGGQGGGGGWKAFAHVGAVFAKGVVFVVMVVVMV